MNPAFILALAIVAVDPQATDTASPEPGPEPRLAIDALPSPFQLAGSLGAEWLFWPRHGLGLWTSASVGRGKNLITGQRNDFESFHVGLAWHPSRKLLSTAFYARYGEFDSEQGIAAASGKVHVLRYETHQVRVGMLGRYGIWKHLGFYWNAGLGFKAGPSRARWIGEEPEDGKTIATIVRLVGYLDLGYGLSLHL